MLALCFLAGRQAAGVGIGQALGLWHKKFYFKRLRLASLFRSLLFSDDGTFLETDKGLLSTTFNSPKAVPSRRNVGAGGIFAKEQVGYLGDEICALAFFRVSDELQGCL